MTIFNYTQNQDNCNKFVLQNQYNCISDARADVRSTSGAISSSGLSTGHNATLSHALFWIGGSKLRVTRNRDGQQIGGGKRGNINGFSRKSRKRMLEKLGELEKTNLPFFVTLTYPDEFFDDRLNMALIKRKHLDRLRLAMKRKYPGHGSIWRMEFMSRKSGIYPGEIFPHFHLLVWGISDRAQLMKWMAITWWKITGKLSENHLLAGTQTDIIHNWRQTIGYVSKYMAKIGDYKINTGRIWGIWNPDNMPFVRAVLLQLTENESIRLIRYMKRYARIHGKNLKSLSIMVNNLDFWYERVLDILYPQ
jgi:hypothetical protein